MDTEENVLMKKMALGEQFVEGHNYLLKIHYQKNGRRED